MEHFNALMIQVDIFQVIQALQYKVRWIIQQVGTFVAFYLVKEHLVSDTIMQVFARVDLVAKVDAVVFVNIQYRCPAFSLILQKRFQQYRQGVAAMGTP
jgi:hypothetical protein